MQGRAVRIVVLLLGICMVFAVVAAILSHVIPGPLRSTDYLVIGTVATFVSLIVLFLVLVKTWAKAPDLFYKRREK